MTTAADWSEGPSPLTGVVRAPWHPARLSVLGQDECMELLNQHDVGRVAWNEPDGPGLVPVNYAMDSGAITFRTALDSAVARRLHLGFASFQIDDHDDVTESGWSVLARGVLSCMESNETFADRAVVPWVSGERHFALRITPLILTGRRIISS